MKKLKVAIVHDYIKEYGGAERVLEALHELYPDAPVFTSVYLPEFLGPHRKRFRNWNIRTSWFQKIPFNYKLISPFRLVSAYVFKSFDFSGYDLIIVSQTGAYFPNAIQKKSALQICYCHTPPRYLYGYMTARNWKSNPVLRIFGEITNHFLRITDFESSENVDYFIANSEEVKKRIKKFYKRDAIIINPPAISASSKLASSVQINKRKKLNADQLDARSYYLTGGRLARAKGTDIIIDAFSDLNKPLIVFGKGFAGFETELRSKIPPEAMLVKGDKGRESKIKFIGEVTEEEKFKLMRKAKAYIFASFDEDFGITPVEAMSVGTPVIAYKSGGVKETVVDGKTGLFYGKNNPVTLAKTVKKFERIKINPKNCIQRAEKFTKESFEKKLKLFIQQHVKIKK